MSDLNTQNTNPLLCDFETGICEMPETSTGTTDKKIGLDHKPIKMIYYTDPICSSCWGIEPQLRKLKLEYGHILDIEYRMGGLLPDWSYNSGGISKPSDVAHHWDEVSHYYDMPIDGDVWLEDPLFSSYPPSIAFKAAQLQDKDKAVVMLRELRELLFLKKKNITKWEFVEMAAIKANLDAVQLKIDYEKNAKENFSEDLEYAQTLGVRGFPTIFFADQNGIQEKVYGSKPYSVFETAVLKLQPVVRKNSYNKDWESLFLKYPTLTSREFSELSGLARQESDSLLENLHNGGQLEKLSTKNGVMWSRIG